MVLFDQYCIFGQIVWKNMQDKENNQLRENRILKAANELFVQYGFDKTTVSEIAKEAGISKGAIYLHFQSKEDLLENLILQEFQAYAKRWWALVEADPQGGSVASMYKNSLYALTESAFMAAIFKQDARILGTYLKLPTNLFKRMNAGGSGSERSLFVKMMQSAGAMRKDIHAEVVAYVMDMLAFALVSMEDIREADQVPALEELIEGIASLMERGLAPEEGYDPAVGKEVLRQISEAGQLNFDQYEQKK